jgi:hypothetical protein
MRCGIVKWLVSSAANRGRNYSRPVRHHLERCPSCREFARFTLALSETAGRDARAYLEKMPVPEIGGLLDKSPDQARPLPFPRRSPKRFWIPASVGIAGLILAAILIFGPASLFRGKASPEEVAEFKKLAFSGGAIVTSAAEAPSSIDQEYESLKKAADSAVRSVLVSLDFKIKPEARGSRAGRS